MTNAPSTNHLSLLETALIEAGLDAYIVPMADEFQGEYTPACAARLPFVTGFTGSAGTGIFFARPEGEHRHTLFVDGRYTLQAANEVDTARINVVDSGDTSIVAWLEKLSGAPLKIGADPWLMTVQQQERWQRATAAGTIEWVIARPNLVDRIWPEQPLPPAGDVVLHPLAFAGASYAQKRDAVLASMAKVHADAWVLTQADAINWLLNLRGSDIAYTPLLLAHLILRKDGSAILYTYPRSWDRAVADYLDEQRVTVLPITEIFEGDCALPSGTPVLMDASSTPYGWHMIGGKNGWNMIAGEDPTQLPKAMKNAVELNGIRAAHRRDGLALTRCLHWLEHCMQRQKLPDELTLVETLEQFRAQDENYRGPSFATIAGSGPHGAIIHYRADGVSNRQLRKGDLLLLDSGGQYPDGTTDVTRTIALGAPTTVMKEHFTRVLKGHIALAAVQFPTGTSGIQLDVLARQHLWSAGLDFDHGTGHGVGAYLCVHEGPQRISKRGSNVALQPGMILSNEPGYYLPGAYGIRIESLLAVQEVTGTPRPMLRFETLTLVPIDTRLVEMPLLTTDERNWLNNYHLRVYATHAEKLNRDEQRWLAEATRAI